MITFELVCNGQVEARNLNISERSINGAVVLELGVMSNPALATIEAFVRRRKDVLPLSRAHTHGRFAW